MNDDIDDVICFKRVTGSVSGPPFLHPIRASVFISLRLSPCHSVQCGRQVLPALHRRNAKAHPSFLLRLQPGCFGRAETSVSSQRVCNPSADTMADTVRNGLLLFVVFVAVSSVDGAGDVVCPDKKDVECTLKILYEGKDVSCNQVPDMNLANLQPSNGPVGPAPYVD
ncbi:hypothetical protein C0Q70_07582 [Pomacea canaliculata]|uniref:Uncharacterized protein n=1 Tax=Pomacea canaliculata TaxID=400727 RepID=A0A2T7PFG1_POMCA|nr:hypothetical protein C0Q70_07582 [Pomacea canaliculata]